LRGNSGPKASGIALRAARACLQISRQTRRPGASEAQKSSPAGLSRLKPGSSPCLA
jgi:hypothetical protein